MNNNFANLLDKSYCIIKNLLDTTDINLIKQDFDLIKTEKFLNPNFNILPVGKKISIDSTISKIEQLSNDIQDAVNIKTNFSSTPIYFSISHGVNFGYHQDHESWFLYGDHANYLSIWIPIIKPTKELTNVVVLDLGRLLLDHPELSFLKNYGATSFLGGSSSSISDDNTGKTITLEFDLDAYSECPQLEEGDALVMRGDCIHKTQDILTDRVAISARRLLTTSIVNKSHFDLTSPVKKQIVENNPVMYQKILNKFKSSDTCTVGDLLEALK
jgi:hypothetical protein